MKRLATLALTTLLATKTFACMDKPYAYLLNDNLEPVKVSTNITKLFESENKNVTIKSFERAYYNALNGVLNSGDVRVQYKLDEDKINGIKLRDYYVMMICKLDLLIKDKIKA